MTPTATIAASSAVKPHLLVVDDESGITTLLKNYLSREGFQITVAGTAAGMRDAVEQNKFEGVLLDVMLPDDDGWAMLRWLRARSNIPVIMLTGKGETIDKIVGLEMGADDYLAKPFELRELLARIRTVLRRSAPAGSTPVPAAGVPAAAAAGNRIEFAEWVLELDSMQLRNQSGELIHLTQAEYRILRLLATNPRRVVTRDQLMDTVAGRDWAPFDRSIDVHVSNLRRKLDPDPSLPSLIRTVRGSGYMFVPSRG